MSLPTAARPQRFGAEKKPRSIAACAGILSGLLAVSGCTSRVQRDVYTQKMSSEIRVLEDQLYDADYQNRVLRDRLEQCRNKKDCEPSDVEMGARPVPPEVDSFIDGPAFIEQGEPIGGGLSSGSQPSMVVPAPFDDFVPDERSNRLRSSRPVESEVQTLETDDFGVIEIDPGEPVASPDRSSGPGNEDSAEAGPLKDPEEAKPTDQDPKPTDGFLLPPAPTEPQPPGRRDLEAPELIPGVPMPPSSDNGDELLPGGQIQLPDSIQDEAPVEIQIHPMFTGGSIDGDGEVEQITVVVHAIDADGKTVPLDGFDVQANLSVIVMDPTRPVGKDKVGRWDFSPTQTATMIQSRPISGLHIPIRWGDDKPDGDEVVIHARLHSGGESLRCFAKLPLVKPTQVSSTWTPRAK